MFKVLILQKFHALADDQCEYQINDRHSFQRFLHLEREARIPDAKTIWRFRERPGREGIEALFAAFDGFLREQGLLLQPGKIIDASFGQTPEGWEENLFFRSQKDTDARHTQKNRESHYGFKKTTSKPTSPPNSSKPGP